MYKKTLAKHNKGILLELAKYNILAYKPKMFERMLGHMMKTVIAGSDAEGFSWTAMPLLALAYIITLLSLFLSLSVGEVRVSLPDMDREVKGQYEVVIQAKDMAGQLGGLAGMTTVNITLSDVNDNPPNFAQSENFSTDTANNLRLFSFNRTSLSVFMPRIPQQFDIKTLSIYEIIIELFIHFRMLSLVLKQL